ncbi:MAG: SDR family oxidoreductase [Anaerolineae bacterium]|jgi:NAD(P)-dependent dehydrogenase (short-subunit alcohol dehydrogenase family)|nr:SDR family oxidoreductase [Anaerolineae bacterium]
MTDLHNKVIFITGGAGGIGGAIARTCAAAGAVVYAADIHPAAGDEGAAEPGAAGTFLQVDVTDPAQVAAAFSAVQARHGRLDGLVCAAGIFRGAFQAADEITLEDFEAVQAVNVRGVLLCVRSALPLLLTAPQGVVIIIASGAGVVGPSASLAYAASKGAASGLSLTLAAQLEPQGIRVNTLSPGNIVTGLKLAVELEDARRRGLPAETAIARAHREYGTPAGVARIAAFMLSDDADYLRGTIFTR